jgi:hypothetical protein
MYWNPLRAAVIALPLVGILCVLPDRLPGDSKLSMPADELAAAAERLVQDLAPTLASTEAYAKTKDLDRPAYTVAVIAQAVAQSDAAVRWKPAATQIRDTAIRLAKRPSYDEATAAYKQLQTLLAEGKGSAVAAPAMKWTEIAPLKPLMIEVNVRTRPLNRTVRSPAQFQKDSETVRRNAAVLELLGVVTAEHPKPKDAQGSTEEWIKWCQAMQSGSAALGRAAAVRDHAAAKTAFTKTRASCTDCHAKFRPEAETSDF